MRPGRLARLASLLIQFRWAARPRAVAPLTSTTMAAPQKAAGLEVPLRVLVDAAGRISLAQGTVELGRAESAPLEAGVDWFVEATFHGESAIITLARSNYGTEKQADIKGSLEVEGVTADATGTKALLVLVSGSGIAPAVDELVVSRCGVSPPALTPALVDDFERPDSSKLGNAQLPSDVAWVASGPDAKIANGALTVTNLAGAHVPLKTVPEDGVRIRATIRSIGAGFWADLLYNSSVDRSESLVNAPGFWLWGPQDSSVFTVIFKKGAKETAHHGKTFADGVDYFVELDRDDGSAVLTIRTGSFTGPLYVVNEQSGLSAAQNLGDAFWLGTSSGLQTTAFEDIRVDVYPMP